MDEKISYSKAIKAEMMSYRTKNACCRKNMLRAIESCMMSPPQFRDGDVGAYYETLRADVFRGGEPDASDVTDELCDMSKLRCGGCRAAILRGIFLAVGSVSDPERRDANLDLSFRAERCADRAEAFLSTLGFDFRRRTRRGSTVLYLKSGEAIGEFFAEAGINRVIYDVSNASLVSDVANFANRRNNADISNLKRATTASERVCDAIRYLISKDKLDALGEELSGIARLRLEYPELTLSQLAAVSPTGISKSALASKLKRIEAYAAKNAGKSDED